jgi:hypothetical protein
MALSTTESKRPKISTRPSIAIDNEPRRASAIGTEDDFCHLLVSGNAYTRCGKRLTPPQAGSDAPGSQWCVVVPEHNPSCPECAGLE